MRSAELPEVAAASHSALEECAWLRARGSAAGPLRRLLVASGGPIFLSTGKVGMAERPLAGLGASLGV